MIKKLYNDRNKSFLICDKFNYNDNDDRNKFFYNYFKKELIFFFFNCDYEYNVNLKGDKLINNCNLIFIDIYEISFRNNCLIRPNN